MRSFKEHSKSPYHFENPIFSSIKVSLFNVDFYLDFNKKDILDGLYYFSSDKNFPFKGRLSFLAESLEKKSFEEIKKNNFETYNKFKKSDELNLVFDLPLYLLTKALRLFEGESPSTASLKKMDPKTLVCRCFGVFEREILDTLREDPNFGLKEISSQTKAAIGCFTCINDVQEVIAKEKSAMAKKLLS